MLRQEYVDNNTRICHFSDENFMIRQIETDLLYEDAVDVLPCKYNYEETDIPIDPVESEPEESNNIS